MDKTPLKNPLRKTFHNILVGGKNIGRSDTILNDLGMQFTVCPPEDKSTGWQWATSPGINGGRPGFLKWRPYQRHSLAKKRYKKLVAQFYEPFQIVWCIEKVASKLDLLSTTSTSYIPCVIATKGSRSTSTSPALPPQLTTELELVVGPEQLLGVRPKSDQPPSELVALLKWKDLPAFKAT